jgi:hypothetical protein
MYVEVHFKYVCTMDTWTTIYVFITNTEINYLKNWFLSSIIIRNRKFPFSVSNYVSKTN